MTDSNPYESPQVAEDTPQISPEIKYDSAWLAFRAGAWRGAKWGTVIMGSFMGLLWLVTTIVTVVVWCVDGIGLSDGPLSLWGVLSMIPSILILTTLYGALPGALLMGILTVLRHSRAKKESEKKRLTDTPQQPAS